MKLFISYRSSNSDRVDSIVTRLRTLRDDAGNPRYTIWQDKHDIPAGKDWWQAIVEAIIDCDVMLFMISRESVTSVNCRAELSYARRRNRPIIPVVLENEFIYNPNTGKNDITYWNDVPTELIDQRAQLLFYEGISFVPRLEIALDLIRQEPQRWRDIPALSPLDPRPNLESDITENTSVIYSEACNYALRSDWDTAERLFQYLVNLNDPAFGEEAYEWIVILREYTQLLRWNEHASTKFKALATWNTYEAKFPKPFISFFDPKGLQAQYHAPKSDASPHTDISSESSIESLANESIRSTSKANTDTNDSSSKRLFITYRRRSWNDASRLYDTLQKLLDAEIFMDFKGIDSDDFEKAILSHLRISDVVMVVVTELTFAADRIHRDDDWVRREIREALILKKPIALACIDGLFPPQDLPEDIRPVRNKEGKRLFAEFFEPGVQQLASHISAIGNIPLRSMSIRQESIPTPNIAHSVSIQDRRDKIEALIIADDYTQAVFELQALIESGFKSTRYWNVELILQELIKLRDAQARRDQMLADYTEIVRLERMAKIPVIKGQATFAWRQFRSDYPEFTDGDDYAELRNRLAVK
ncbi:MAG: toll/interleukin-1 receptor domain-containing protein [Anaerolineae bacterium]|nr:toll/interleukin-1 receptor domain-containing protein [Anaerolineae bacterium]